MAVLQKPINRVDELAETLIKSGIATTKLDAKRMAKNMLDEESQSPLFPQQEQKISNFPKEDEHLHTKIEELQSTVETQKTTIDELKQQLEQVKQEKEVAVPVEGQFSDNVEEVVPEETVDPLISEPAVDEPTQIVEEPTIQEEFRQEEEEAAVQEEVKDDILETVQPASDEQPVEEQPADVLASSEPLQDIFANEPAAEPETTESTPEPVNESTSDDFKAKKKDDFDLGNIFSE